VTYYIRVKDLHKRDRERTPEAFARYLIRRVSILFPDRRIEDSPIKIAALFCSEDSVYHDLLEDVYTETRDAHTYRGPYPIIAHPPCGPWGKLRYFSDEDCEHGIKAMELVHRWGGVVEQPKGSQLFIQYGRGGVIEECNQGDYGHRATKPTLLYWYVPPRILVWTHHPSTVPKPRRRVITNWTPDKQS